MLQRQDAWSEENDLLLAETVLRHIREGSTQLNAFEEVGDQLNRTSAACGFRWNAVVRQDYMKAIEIAKKQRKQRQRALGEKTKPLYIPPAPILTFETSEELIVEKDDKNDIKFHTQPMPIEMSQSSSLSMDDIIRFLSNLKNNNQQSNNLQQKNDRLKMDNKALSDEIVTLKQQIDRTEREFEIIKEDYQALVKIMDRARKLVLFEEEVKPANMFKMDKNGNLERIAK